MKVIPASSAGFCWGVRRAVECASATAEKTQGAVYTDGPLIHNPAMIRDLEGRGVRVTTAPETLPEGATLIIRAHGIAPEHRKYLESLPIKIVDATCPEVARIQGVIRSHVAQGYAIIIHGDKGHAEVVGLCGHAQGRGFVVESAEDVAALEGSTGLLTCAQNTQNTGQKTCATLGKVCVVAQSTQEEAEFARVAEAVRGRFSEVRILDTICEATKNRQRELRRLAQTCQKIVVVGSRMSANSLRLAHIASEVCPTVMVADAEELRAEDFIGVTTVGLTAGASTPDTEIAAVRKKLERF